MKLSRKLSEKEILLIAVLLLSLLVIAASLLRKVDHIHCWYTEYVDSFTIVQRCCICGTERFKDVSP